MKQRDRHTWGPLSSWGHKSPSLLLLPGAGGQATELGALLDHLETPAAAVDLPGHGENDGALLSTVEEMAEAIESALAAIGRPLVLLGHSLGGAVALEVALRKRAALKAIILYSTGARLRVDPGIFQALEQIYDLRTKSSVRGLFGAHVADEVLDGYLALPRHPTNIQAITDFRAADRFDRMTRLGEVAVKTLVIGGDSDAMTPAKYQAYLAGGIPGATRVVIEGTGHMIHVEEPRKLAAAVDQFVRSLG